MILDKQLHRIKEDFDAVQSFLLALGDEKRQAILIALMHSTQKDGLRVNDFSDTTGLSRPAISHHLKILTDAGLLQVKAVGTKNYYQLDLKADLKRLQGLTNDVLSFLATKEGN